VLCADDVNIMGHTKNNIKTALLEASREVGLEVSKNKTKYMVHEEIKSRLNSGNACYNFLQNLLYLSLLSRNLD
jgi:hypothetical protein